MGHRGRPRTRHRQSLSPLDTGSPDLHRHRIAAGIPPGSATSHDHPVDILLSRGLITDDHHAAALRLAAVHASLHGWAATKPTAIARLTKSDPNHDQIYLHPHPIDPDLAEVRKRRLYRHWRAILQRHGPSVTNTTINIACYNRSIADAWKRPHSYRRDIADLRTGLDAIATAPPPQDALSH